jgi:hypothetical protein
LGVALNNLNPVDGSSYFVNLSDSFGLPCIPVINTANAGNTFVEIVSDQNATATTATINFVELSQKPV